jgi:ACS family glucarate transporter-like MFS transporter
MTQYIASNFTFYFALAWMYPYLKERFALSGMEAGWFAMVPLIAGAGGNWFSGLLVDAIYKKGQWKFSRQIPAVLGFLLAALGMALLAIIDASPGLSIVFLSIAIFGADMTLSPSWAFCIDIGKENAGTVSGTMNMAGNLGAFVTIIAFPYLLEWTGMHEPFFYVCCSLSAIGIFMWGLMKPEKGILSK